MFRSGKNTDWLWLRFFFSFFFLTLSPSLYIIAKAKATKFHQERHRDFERIFLLTSEQSLPQRGSERRTSTNVRNFDFAGMYVSSSFHHAYTFLFVSLHWLDGKDATSPNSRRKCWMSISTPISVTPTLVRRPKKSWPESVGYLCRRSVHAPFFSAYSSVTISAFSPSILSFCLCFYFSCVPFSFCVCVLKANWMCCAINNVFEIKLKLLI